MSPTAEKVLSVLKAVKEAKGTTVNHEYNAAVKAWNNKATASEMFDKLVELKKGFAHRVKYLSLARLNDKELKASELIVNNINEALELLKIAIHK